MSASQFQMLILRAQELALRIVLENLESGRYSIDEAHAKIMELFK